MRVQWGGWGLLKVLESLNCFCLVVVLFVKVLFCSALFSAF